MLEPLSIQRLCDRHFGIGADGLMILNTSIKADFEMKYFNSDGYPGTMCGNGGRCIAAFAQTLGIYSERCSFVASDGLHTAEIQQNGEIRLSMNNVSQVRPIADGFFLDTGSPHYIEFSSDISAIDVFARGRDLRNNPVFPGGTNVNFVEIHNDSIRVRTYERGVEDETLSCGTGVTAAAIAAHINNPSIKPPVRVETMGGTLHVEFVFNESVTDIYLTGPAEYVFHGTIESSDL